jgi:hypothetical protein
MSAFTRRNLFASTTTLLVAATVGGAMADAQHSTIGSNRLGLQVAATTQVSGKVAETKAALRDLWVGHIFWVRGVVFATSAKNGSAASAAEQATVANAKEIAGAIAPFYGPAAADQLFSLLAGHYGAIKEYLDAAVKQDSSGGAAATDHLTANARDIAAFLSGANPNLPKDALEELLMAHGGHHLQQIQEVQAGQFEKEAQTWSAMKGHIYVIADALTDALAKQFPERF